MSEAPWSQAEFEARLREKGAEYHIYHPVNRWLNEGHATREQLQIWTANRWHYQISIPIKDAAILSNCPDRTWRRRWIKRILDHDGHGDDPGGIEAWAQLGHAVGLTRADLESERLLLPGVRFAVDAYVNFARQRPWQEAVTASLTELFASNIHEERLANWPKFYPWLGAEGMIYFHNRVSQARQDVAEALALTLEYYDTRALQLRARHPAVQARRAVADERCDGARLPSGGALMARIEGPPAESPVTDASIPAIGKGFRLQWEKAQNAHVLLYAEGMVTLNGSAGAILSHCDGKKSVAEIVTELQQTYNQQNLGGDVLAFLRIAVANNWVQLQ